MGRRRARRVLDVPSQGVPCALVVLAISFGLGALVGCALAASVGEAGNQSLAAYIQSYLEASQNGLTRSIPLPALVWETMRWPLLTVLLGFTALGILGLPVLFAARGFLLSFAASSFVRAFGAPGGGLAFFAFGITALLSVPALFVLGVQGFRASRRLAARALGDGKSRLPFDRIYFLRCGVCAGVFFLCMVLDYWVVPALVGAVAGGFS